MASVTSDALPTDTELESWLLESLLLMKIVTNSMQLPFTVHAHVLDDYIQFNWVQLAYN